jgi:hypothetical protein
VDGQQAGERQPVYTIAARKHFQSVAVHYGARGEADAQLTAAAPELLALLRGADGRNSTTSRSAHSSPRGRGGQ